MKNFRFFNLLLFSFLLLFFPLFIFSQNDGLSLTITPPLIKINVSPGQSWSSFIKVVNSNPQPLTVFASLLDFKSDEEGGVVFFSPPKNEESKKAFLSQWIEISKEPILIPPFQSKEIPFTISVPKEADPGGHYGAILIGTQPLNQDTSGTVIKISQQISSLVLLNVEGEIFEKGWIREFTSDKNFYQKPEIKLKLTFENLGNNHLQPVGEIKIYNFFGKERGKIPINQNSDFGNVLAKSKRVWNFEWKGEKSLFEVGRYKAEVILTFGSKNTFSERKIIYFWVVPLIQTVGILGGIILFFLFVFLAIKLYVQRAVRIAQKEILTKTKREYLPKEELKIKINTAVLKKPFQEFIVDLKSKERKISKINFFKKYSTLFLFLLLVFFWIFLFYFYFSDVYKSEKSFEVLQKESINKEDSVFFEEIFKKETKEEKDYNFLENKESNISKKNNISLVLLNGSGIPKLAAKVAIFLENQDFFVEKTANAESFNFNQSMIKYKKNKEKEAELVKENLKKEILMELSEEQKEDIVLIIGKDFKDFNF